MPKEKTFEEEDDTMADATLRGIEEIMSDRAVDLLAERKQEAKKITESKDKSNPANF